MKNQTSVIAKHHIRALHEKFQMYGKNAREWMRKCALLLPEIERERVWEAKGFGSIYEYAAKLAGMNHDAVNDALRVLRRTENMPAIRAVIAARGINAVKPVVGLLTDTNQGFWAEKVRVMSKNTLEMYVRELRQQGEVFGDCATELDKMGLPRKAESGDLSQQQAAAIVMELDPAVAAELEKFKGDGDWNALMKEFLQMKRDHMKKGQLECDKPKAVVATSRHIPMKIQRHIVQRSRGLCEFPQCTRAYDSIHHTQRFALERVHDPDRMVALCTAHERIAHLGLIEGESHTVNEWHVCARADERDPRFAIDRMVAQYRVGST